MNIEEVKQIIAAADVCGDVPLIKGLHGIGKSESAAQYAKQQDMHYEPLILSLMDTGDLLGIPDTVEVSGFKSTLWSAPSWFTNIINAAWPQDTTLVDLQFIDTKFQEFVLNSIEKDSELDRGLLNALYCKYYDLPNDRLQLSRQDNVRNLRGRRSLLNLDEFNRAQPDILNACLQLILEHRLHSHELPIVNGRETLIVAAINPSNGDYSVQEFDPAMLDRFLECEVTPDLNAWIKWAKLNNVHDTVIEFLLVNKSKFHFEPEDGSKGASPRSWTKLARYISNIDKTPPDIMSHYLRGTVGSSLAAQFLQFYNSNKNALTYKKLDAFIKSQLKDLDNFNIEITAKKVSTKIEDLEAMVKLNYADTFLSSYFKTKKDEDNLPALVYLYALPLENLASVLKKIQTEDAKIYAEIAKLDKVYNNKGLFLKLVSLKKKD